jgi:hypothetical protein
MYLNISFKRAQDEATKELVGQVKSAFFQNFS